MQVVLLAGGLGTRLAEKTQSLPKPMVTIGDKPLLWHLMKFYSHFGFRKFVFALGYKNEVIKSYFSDPKHWADSMRMVGVDGALETYFEDLPPWEIHLQDTGPFTETGGRLKRLSHILKTPFLLTYGDGLSNVDIHALLRYHQEHGKKVTLSAVKPPMRFGHLDIERGLVKRFQEKDGAPTHWINGGFMVVEPEVLSRIPGDDTSFEKEILPQLANDNELAAFMHEGFWQCMDTLHEQKILEQYWKSGYAPWQVWT